MTNIEFEIMDELYFPCSFGELVSKFTYEKQEIYDVVVSLLQKEFIVQLQFNSSTNDFEKQEQSDFHTIEKSSFVATKRGLLEHTTG